MDRRQFCLAVITGVVTAGAGCSGQSDAESVIELSTKELFSSVELAEHAVH